MCYPAQRILVVDDHGAVRQMISRMLARHGFHTLEAEDGHQALTLFQQAGGQIDLVILDVLMPGMSGLDVAAELGRQAPGLKILYISSSAGSIAIEGIRRQSPQSLLLKPFTERHLLERIDGMFAPPDDVPDNSPDGEVHPRTRRAPQ